jgi:hypothetical protein
MRKHPRFPMSSLNHACVQNYLPGERQEDDPFDKDKMRRLILIRTFLVLMRQIKLQQFVVGKEIQWPPLIKSVGQVRQPEIKDWVAWKKQVFYLTCYQSAWTCPVVEGNHCGRSLRLDGRVVEFYIIQGLCSALLSHTLIA